eukprot:1827394-Prymnesium_polylepis.1
MLASLSRALVCRLSRTYSEVTYSIYEQRVICSLPCSNTDANDHARLTGRLEVLGRAECDIGRLRRGVKLPISDHEIEN